MPKITNSNGDLNKAFFGTAEVDKIFLGSTELYSKAAPVGYVILAGTYYGKRRQAVNFLYDGVIDISFVGGQETFVGMFKSGFYLYYIKSDNTQVVALDLDDGWQSSDYRTIEVANDTTVTQAEYDSFFGTYDAISG